MAKEEIASLKEKINKLKQQACLSSGYRFKFVIK